MDSTSETLTSLFRRYSEVMDDVGECDGMIFEENQAKIAEIKSKIKGRDGHIEYRIRATRHNIKSCAEMIERAFREVDRLEESVNSEEIKLMRWEELLEMAK